MIEKNNANYRIIIFNLNVTKDNYNINLKTLSCALLIINSYEIQFAEQIENLK